jgi:hypothetical protein
MPTHEATITVDAKVLGQRKPLVTDRRVPLSLEPAAGTDGHGVLRLHDLLAQIVRQEVHAFTQRQEEQRLVRVLSPQAITHAAARGKIAMGGLDDRAPAEVNEDAAVAVALQAFTDGLYFVFLDEVQQQDLDAEVLVRPDSRLTFIRLVALAGG